MQVIAICAVGVMWLLYLRLLNPIADRLEQVTQHTTAKLDVRQRCWCPFPAGLTADHLREA
jgi:hypothetical protein